MYIIHLEWNHFIEHIIPDTKVWMQDYEKSHRDRYGCRLTQHYIIASFTDDDRMLHAAHLPVSEVSSLPGEVEDDNARTQRRVARKIVYDELMLHVGCAIYSGLLLTAGLSEDLDRYHTAHAMWTWVNRDDPAARRLVSTNRGAA